MHDYQRDFIKYTLDSGVLKFGEFELKSGRISPYFFNTGLFDTGAKLARLGEFYARALIQSEITVDILYGPAYKGIPLVSTTAIAYSQLTGQDIPFVFNRKEQKGHGEGGNLVGADLQGRTLILDDVITAGTSIRESVAIIRQAGASPCAVLIALDRQEKGEKDCSATQDVTRQFNIPVIAIISFADIIEYLESQGDVNHKLANIKKYRHEFGV